MQPKALAKLGIVEQHRRNIDVAKMLPSFATMSANKSMKKFVAQRLERAQTFGGTDKGVLEKYNKARTVMLPDNVA